MNKSFKITHQLFFAQRLSLLLTSGISMVEALTVMKNIEQSLVRKKVYELLLNKVHEGVSLGKSIQSLNLHWNDLLVALIRNGEEGGHLAEALYQAYRYLEKKDTLKKKIVSTLVYPGFIVCATIGMTLFLILYIFPKIIPLLQSLNIQLPFMTRVVQEIYYFLLAYGLWSVGIIFLVFIGIKVLLWKSSQVKRICDGMYIKIPILQKYIKINTMISICTMGEMFLASGKGLPDMLLFSRNSLRNSVYKKAFTYIHFESTQGAALSGSLRKREKLFPPLMIDMCMLGEKTGSLGSMLGHCSHIFEQDMENVLKKFSSLIEPVLMVFMGILVGSIALSIILPVYEITNHLSQ